MKVPRHCFQQLAVATFTTIGFYVNSVSAEIVPDTTLPNNSSITQLNNIKVIEGGTEAGSNLFHSFKQFSLPTGSTAYFNNSRDIQNIITRVTGNNISNIDGILRANGTADLFLINPNGIIFGENASLDIGGSFLATTANSINFANGTEFSATEPETTPLLTISVPIGLQFGATPAPIINQSQASPNGGTNLFKQPVGLQVPVGETLALIGGDVILEGGNLTADSGRIELGSVGSNSVVSLNSIDQGWALGYEGLENFGNIQLIERSNNGLTIASQIDVSGEDGGGTIQVQGNSIELIGDVTLNSTTTGVTDAGDITINGRKLVVRNGAQVTAGTRGKGSAGNIIVNASDSVELIGDDSFFTLLSSDTAGDGNGGNITINTSRLFLIDGARVSVGTGGRADGSQFILATGEGGNLTINASELVEIVGTSAQGDSSSLTSQTINSSEAGNLTISTKKLIVRDGGEITVSSLFFKSPGNFFTVVGDTSTLGDAGDLNITAESIVLDNQGGITSETETGNGGNINLQIQDLLVMLDNSQISTSAGTALLQGDGGNITINIPEGFIVADANGNSDITANAFTGSGGNVNINVFSIYGMEPLSRDELVELLGTDNPSELNPQSLTTNNITAISQQNPNLNGELNINATDTEPTKDLIELPDAPIDAKMSENCKPNKDRSIDQFIYVGQGGIRPLPGDERVLHFVLDGGWIELEETKGDGKKVSHPRAEVPSVEGSGASRRGRWGDGEMGRWGKGEKEKRGRILVENRIAEATHWVVDENGDIFFVAGQPDDSSNKFNEVGCKG